MIDYIFWHYYGLGLHLVTFIKGKDRMMSSAAIAEEFSLGELRRVGA